MIKNNWVYLLFAFAVALFTVTRFTGNAQQHADNIKVTVKTFHTNMGWGYDVYTNDSVYIHQEYIPALEGRKGFATEAEALAIGQLVLTKMNRSKFPVVSLEELDSCGIKR
jgi:hypothetical protein